MKRAIVSARCVIGILIAIMVFVDGDVRCWAQPTAEAKTQVAPIGNAIPEAFRTRDSDGDGALTEEEFVAGGGQEKAALQRDFKVFDANRDGRLSVTEFLSIPAFT